MSQVEQTVNQVVPENVGEDVPKYVKDRRRRQFLADMACCYDTEESTTAQFVSITADKFKSIQTYGYHATIFCV